MQIKAPIGWRPDDIQSRPVTQQPAHSRYRKCDLYQIADQFNDIDQHAIQVAQTDHNNFNDLVYHLVYVHSLQTQLDKCRAIFRWMTSKNLDTIQFHDGAKPGSPDEVVLSFRNKQGSYAKIFSIICRFCGIQASVVTGLAKGLDFRSGGKVSGDGYSHSWNCVLIDGNFYLVDCHWATRYLTSERNQKEIVVYDYDDFYFLTDPEQLIYSHFPHQKELQLLHNPLTVEEFEMLPLVKSYFFKCAMYFISHHKGVAETKNGRLALALGYSKQSCFTYKVTFVDGGSELFHGQSLKNFVLQHVSGTGKVNFLFRAPKSGAYYVTIFAKLVTGEFGIKNTYTAACEYKIIADNASPDGTSLPSCSDSLWGPGLAVDQLGLVASPQDGIIATDKGSVSLEFKKTKPASVLCRLKRQGMKDKELAKCISEKDGPDSVQVTVQLPSTGEYGIEVFGNDPSKDAGTYTHICQYYVHFAPPKELQAAFYHDSPEYRAQLAGDDRAAVSRGQHKPDTFGLDSATANLALDDPDLFPPPPPELLQQQYLYGTVPDTRQQAVVTNYVPQKNQGFSAYVPGTGQMDIGQPQKATVTSKLFLPMNSKSLDVEQRSVGQAPPSVPKEFRLSSVMMKGDSETPDPSPSTGPSAKPTLNAVDRKVLQSVDNHAIQVSKSDHSTFPDLMWDLIYSKNITNEIERVRVIFRWLATKNLKVMSFDKVDKGSPEEVLTGLKAGTTTYAMVFDTLCANAGLHSKIITGYAKGADYRPGHKLQPGHNQHSWNAIYINGVWYLVDAHWAARRIIGKQTSTEEFHYQLDEFFFLPDPHKLIYSHFPDDPRWQLLERCISLEEFENMPHMKPQFFKYELEFITHCTSVIHSRGETHIRLRYPADSMALVFNFTLQFEDGNEEYDGMKLSRYGMHECVGGVASFSFRLPVSGSYILYIYAKEDCAQSKDTMYAQVCEYRIEHLSVNKDTSPPYPPCSTLTWGIGSAFYRYGLSVFQQSSIMYTREGKVELQIKQTRPMQFMAKLKSNAMADSELDPYVVHRVVGNTVYFSVTAPARGEYGVEIYANDPASEGQTLYHVAQFLLLCLEDCHVQPLPKLPPGYLGLQPKFSELGMMTRSHHDPIVQLDCNAVTISLGCQQKVRMTANLLRVEDDKDFPEYVFSNAVGMETSFVVNVPSVGFYKLQIYGLPESEKSSELPGVFNYLINCRKLTQAVFPFPKQYAQWKDGCFMREPGVIPTARGQFASQVKLEHLPREINFRVSIPRAQAVAVVAGAGKWTHLSLIDGAEWVGTVDVGHMYGSGEKLTLNASYESDTNSYATLLEYVL